jgi:threonine synthase
MSRSTAFNPMTLEGKKTVSLEIFQQLKKAPEHVFVPTGDGCILGGVYKGFKDLVELGLIQEMPTVHCVQAENSNAINRALKNGDFDQKPSSTIADSISVDIPRNGYYALKQLKKYQGNAVNVTDQEIKEAQKRLSSSTGLFTEPAGAAAFAGLLKIKEDLNPKDTIVVLATGSGLKDILTAGSGVDVPEKTIESLDEI